MKPDDVVEFQNRKATRYRYNNQSENFEKEIITKGGIDKALIVLERPTDAKQPWKTIYEVMFLILSFSKLKNQLNKLVLKMGCFLVLLKPNRHSLQNQTSLQKIKIN